MRFSNIIITILLFNSVYLFESIYAWTFAEHYCVVVVPLAICGISFFVVCINKLFMVTVHENRKFEMEMDVVRKCHGNECCDFPHVQFDMTSLGEDLQKSVFGQHVVTKVIVPLIREHRNRQDDLTVTKPLVLSLHGDHGTGKHHVVDLMIKHLYMMGRSSQYVHRFDGKTDFPDASMVNTYREIIKTKVFKAMRICERALIVFENMQDLPESVVESISAVLEHLSNMGGTAYQQATIVLISTSGSERIRHVLDQNMNDGYLRERMTLQQFADVLAKSAYVANDRAEQKSLIPSSVIDAYIPFLPLEREHVGKCIEDEYKRYKKFITSDDSTTIVNKYFTFDGNYVVNGCKEVREKVTQLATIINDEL